MWIPQDSKCVNLRSILSTDRLRPSQACERSIATTRQVNHRRTRIGSPYPFSVCFHRAFDMTPDPHAALQHLYSIPGITRVLTRYDDTPIIPDPVTLFLTAQL